MINRKFSSDLDEVLVSFWVDAFHDHTTYAPHPAPTVYGDSELAKVFRAVGIKFRAVSVLPVLGNDDPAIALSALADFCGETPARFARWILGNATDRPHQ